MGHARILEKKDQTTEVSEKTPAKEDASRPSSIPPPPPLPKLPSHGQASFNCIFKERKEKNDDEYIASGEVSRLKEVRQMHSRLANEIVEGSEGKASETTIFA